MRHSRLIQCLLGSRLLRLGLAMSLAATAGVWLKVSQPTARASVVAPAVQQAAGTVVVAPASRSAVQTARQNSDHYIWMEVTAYCPCKACCGRRARGITASGKSVRHNGGRFVAADTDVLPFGTRVSVPGYHDGLAVPVIDTGSAINGHRLDVFFRTHHEAEEWGRQLLRVRVDRQG